MFPPEAMRKQNCITPYVETPVTAKFMCVVVKDSETDGFVVTAYYTDTEKKGTLVWQKK